MAIHENDDITQRFRAYQPQQPRPRRINDVQPSIRSRSLPPPSAMLTSQPRPRLSAIQRPVIPEEPVITLPEDAITQQNVVPVLPPSRPTRPFAQQPKRRRWFRVTRGRIIVVILLIILVVGVWFGAKAIGNVNKVFRGGIFSVLTTTKLKGEETGRVNILVAGNSADDPGHDGANLTDSIMVISVDVKHNSALLLSIPRDLWVNIPGYGHAKINEAYVDGENGKFSTSGYAPGGMGLLEQVVQQNLGIKANYYALVDYNALRDGVDAVGGVDVKIASDDPRGLYDPSIDYATHKALVRLTNGAHHLNGEQSLDLSRARGDAYGAYGFARSDFERTQNQRLLIIALKSKITSVGTLANPVAISKLFDTLGSNVKTDLSLGEVNRSYSLGKNISNANIQSVGLNDVNGVNYLANYASPNGESALIPAAGLDNFNVIRQQIVRLMTSDPIVRESAKVVILNGTPTAGLAAQTQKVLSSQNLTVSAVGDAKVNIPVTTIIDTTSVSSTKPATLAFLKKTFGVMSTTINPYAGLYNADFIIVVGADWATTHPPTVTHP
jgi:LCP family protein required for cell wall assembly